MSIFFRLLVADMAQYDGAIGIDLGNSYTCVAVWHNNRAEVIPNEQGNRTTPCCVCFTEAEVLVGEPALSQLAKNPRNTVCHAKQLLGRSFDDVLVQQTMKNCGFEVKDKDGAPVIVVRQGEEEREVTPEELSGMVLKFMRDTAEAFLGKTVMKAVISVPSSFTDAQRQATRDAAGKAGLEVLRIVNEPTAAAIAYGLDAPSREKDEVPRLVLVFDFGGTSLDVSLMRVDEGLFEVLATAADTALGGEDLDSVLVAHFVKEFKRKHKMDITESKRSVRRLRTACERAKRVLSTSNQTALEAESLHEGIDFFTNISRVRFEEMAGDVLKRCVPVLDEVLASAKVDKSAVSDVVMAGGSSRIPRVQALVGKYFNGVELRTSISTDEAVACGAAAQGFVLAGGRSKHTDALATHDVTPLSIGVEVEDGAFAVVIPRNTPVPHKNIRTMSTSVENQNAVYLQVYQGERALATDNILLGTVALEGLQKAPAGEPKIQVTFAVDENGCVAIEAVEATSGVKAELNLKSGGPKPSPSEIDELVVAGHKERTPAPEPSAEKEFMPDAEPDPEDNDMD